MDIKKLFGVNSSNVIQSVEITQGRKQESETYQQWGHRMAGRAEGKASSLTPHLQIVYMNIRKEQEADAELQQELQNDISKKITNEKTQLAQEESNLEHSRAQSDKTKTDIADISEKLSELKGNSKRKNSEAVANLVIGLIILFPLTLYLFLFYSSTAYSAFFKEFDFSQALSSHMFDARALAESWAQSWTAGLFVLLITFVFMALGLVLYMFTQQKSNSKYFKAGCIILVTFAFDSLLAFLIAKNVYDAESLTIIENRPPYNLSMAVIDPSFWIVIFCGFLAYIIWGLLFGFVMDNYNRLDLNKVEREKLERKLENLQKQDQNEFAKQSAIANKIKSIEGKIASLEESKLQVKRYDTTEILLELNNFFSGWLHYMNGAAKDNAEIDQANTVFAQFVQTIKNQ